MSVPPREIKPYEREQVINYLNHVREIVHINELHQKYMAEQLAIPYEGFTETQQKRALEIHKWLVKHPTSILYHKEWIYNDLTPYQAEQLIELLRRLPLLESEVANLREDYLFRFLGHIGEDWITGYENTTSTRFKSN